MLKEASTITDIHNNCDATEVELVSLVTEKIPKYQLRADSVFGYNQRDWLQTPILSQDANVDLSPELCKETLNYFILSGDRLSQMTRTYHDIEAVTHLLEEKERDLELAARIGQTLLQKNREITQRNDQLEEQLAGALDEVSQLRHEISLKEDLLHTYADDETDSSGAPSPVKELRNFGRSVMYNHIEALQEKIRKLEVENTQLKLDQVKYETETEALESQEQKLVSDTFKELEILREELRDVKENNSRLHEELVQRNEEGIRQQEEITRLLTQIVDMQRKQKQLALENEELQQHLTAANNTQYELTREIQTLEDRYQEMTNILDETREEARLLRDCPEQFGRAVPFRNSLAAELESSAGFSTELQLQDSHSLAFPISAPISWSSPPSSVIDGETEDEGCPDLHASRTDLPNRIIKSEPRPKNVYSESPSQRVLNTARFVNNVKSFSVNSHLQYATPRKQERPIPTHLLTPGSNRCLHASPDSTPSSGFATPSLGRPGVPGTDDLERAIRKLALRRESARYMEIDRRYNRKNEESFGPIEMGSFSPGSAASGVHTPPPSCPSSPVPNRRYRYGRSSLTPKLRIVKPLEGSVTLNQWKYLAERDRMLSASQLKSEVAPGIITRDRVTEVLSRSKDGSCSDTCVTTSLATYSSTSTTTPIKSSVKDAWSRNISDISTPRLPAPSQHLNDYDEARLQEKTKQPNADAPKKGVLELSPICPGKGFALTSTKYTFTNSCVRNPRNGVSTTPPWVTTSSSKDSVVYSSATQPLTNGVNKGDKGQQAEFAKRFYEESTRTCSMQLGLAHLFREHGTKDLPTPRESSTNMDQNGNPSGHSNVDSQPVENREKKSVFEANTAPLRSCTNHIVWNRSLQRTFLLPLSSPGANLEFNINSRSNPKKPDTPPNSPITSVPSSSSFLLNEILAETSQPSIPEPEGGTLFSSNLLSKLAQIGWMGLQGFKAAKNLGVQKSAFTSCSRSQSATSTARERSPRNSLSKSATAPASLRAKDAVVGTSSRNFSQLSLDEKRPVTTPRVQGNARIDWAELHGSSGALTLAENAKNVGDGYLDEVAKDFQPRSRIVHKNDNSDGKSREGLRLLLDKKRPGAELKKPVRSGDKHK